MNVKMFEGQTTAFLGHNGAGKTSTISMLTGQSCIQGYQLVSIIVNLSLEIAILNSLHSAEFLIGRK